MNPPPPPPRFTRKVPVDGQVLCCAASRSWCAGASRRAACCKPLTYPHPYPPIPPLTHPHPYPPIPPLTHPHPSPLPPMLATGSRDRDNQGAALEHRSPEPANDSPISPADIRVAIAPSSSGKAGQQTPFVGETPDGSPMREGLDGSRAVGFGRGGGGEALHAHGSGGDYASKA